MEIHGYTIIVGLLGILFFASAIYAFFWAIQKEQMKNLEAASRSIFTKEEPEGDQTDFFPEERENGLKGENY